MGTKLDENIAVFGEPVGLSEKIKRQKRARYSANREEICLEHAPYQRIWRKTNSRSARISKLKHRYGLTEQQQDFICAKLVCDCCGAVKRLVIDHDHLTKQVRGRLCDDCNVGIGRLKDSPELLRKAINYLEITAPQTIEKLKCL